MVDFDCPECGAGLEAGANAVGRKINCAKCNAEVIVPMPDFLPRVACPNCEHELDDLTADQAGRLVKCPKCGVAVQAPSANGGTGCGILGLVGLVAIVVSVSVIVVMAGRV